MSNFLLKRLFFVVVLLALVLSCFDEGSGSSQAQQRGVRGVGHLLKSWTFNGEDQTLSWVMSEWTVSSNSKLGPAISRTYRINLQEATTTVDGKTREMDSYESVLVYRNIEVITQYLLDRVEWWRDGRLPSVGKDRIVPR